MRRKEEDAYSDFMCYLEKMEKYKKLTKEEQKFLKDNLEQLYEDGGVHGTYQQREGILIHCVAFFFWGAGYRPGEEWREDVD